MKYFFLLLTSIGCLIGCNTIQIKNKTPMYDDNPCTFEYKELSSLTIGDLKFNGNSGISLAILPKVTALLAGAMDTIPMEFFVNINIKNKSTDSVLLDRMNYKLSFDGVIFDKGTVNDSLLIEPTDSILYPLFIQIDLFRLTNDLEKRQKIADIVKRMLKTNDNPVNGKVVLDSLTYKYGEYSVISPESHILEIKLEN